MKVGERGQITIPKEIRDKFGLTPNAEVEFHVIEGNLILMRKPKKPDFERWIGYCKASFDELGYQSGDEYIEDIRGR